MGSTLDMFCRLCAREKRKGCLTPLGHNPSLARKIERLFSVKLNEHQALPKCLCQDCYCNVEDAFAFYSSLCAANKKLKNLISDKEQAENKLSYHKGIVNDYPDGCPKCINMDDASDNQSQIKCPHCSQTMHSKNLLRTHVKLAHGSQAPSRKYRCRVCGLELLTSEERREHEEKHLGEANFPCHVCGKKFARSNNLAKHMVTHSPNRPKLPCDLCSKTFVNRTLLKEHMNMHLGVKPYCCDVCDKSFHGKGQLRQHRWTHKGKTFNCPHCEQTFTRKGNMKAHVHEFHFRREPTEPLSAFEDGDQDRHVSSTSAELSQKLEKVVKLECKKCNETFDSRKARKEHNAQNHPDIANCDICGKQFKHHGSLTYHRRVVHTNEKPFKCGFCGDRFPVQTAKTAHERKEHTGERPFVCPDCARSFFRVTDLRSHATTHSTHCTFICEQCGKSFRRKTTLTAHLKRHGACKDHKCTKCSKEFVEKSDLQRHEVTHGPESHPFFCSSCGDSFGKKKEVVKHAFCRSKRKVTSEQMFKDFLQQYNKISEKCFEHCINDLSSRSLTQYELNCVENCAHKFVMVNNKAMHTYMEVQPAMTQRRIDEMNKQSQANVEGQLVVESK